MDHLAKVWFGDDWIGLRLDGTWEPSSTAVASLARMAVVLSQSPYYEYSPSHGAYGPLLANQVKEKLGGTRVQRLQQATGVPPAGVVF